MTSLLISRRGSAKRVLLALMLVTMASPSQPSASAGLQQGPAWLAAFKQWRVEVIVTSDCDRAAPDGSRTIIHNRIATTYDFTKRLADAPVSTWTGRASTTYRWSVGTEFRDRRDVEESEASFESDGKLELTESIRITIGRLPGRPFTRKQYLGETLLESSTANDEPPAAELNHAPLPADDGTGNGSRAEAAYSLLGGLVLTCPARRQWTIRGVA